MPLRAYIYFFLYIGMYIFNLKYIYVYTSTYTLKRLHTHVGVACVTQRMPSVCSYEMIKLKSALIYMASTFLMNFLSLGVYGILCAHFIPYTAY